MSVLFIGAHPDDVEYGCAGTMLKYAKAGYQVYLLILTPLMVLDVGFIEQSEVFICPKLILYIILNITVKPLH